MPSTTEFVPEFFSEPHGPYPDLSDCGEPGCTWKLRIASARCRSRLNAGSRLSQRRHGALRGARGSRSISSAGKASGNRRQANRLQRRHKRRWGRPDTAGDERGRIRRSCAPYRKTPPDWNVVSICLPPSSEPSRECPRQTTDTVDTVASNTSNVGKRKSDPIRNKCRYAGPIPFANDLDCFPVKVRPKHLIHAWPALQIRNVA